MLAIPRPIFEDFELFLSERTELPLPEEGEVGYRQGLGQIDLLIGLEVAYLEPEELGQEYALNWCWFATHAYSITILR